MEAEDAWDAVSVQEPGGDAVPVALRVGRGGEALPSGENVLKLCRDGVALGERVAELDMVCVSVGGGERDTRAVSVP